MRRVLRNVAVVLAAVALGYVLALVFLFSSCSTSGSGIGDKRPTTATEP